MGSGANMITITATPDLSAITGVVNSTVYNFDLNDLFTTARAAGSVNGTAAEPGPGTRAVTDTNSKLSLSGGNLVLDSTGSWSDPRCYYFSMSRTPGLMSVVRAKYDTSAKSTQFAAITNSASTVNIGYRLHSGSSNTLDFRVSATIKLIATVHDTFYTVVQTHRAAGSFIFIKGGSITDWTLLYIDGTKNDATLYAMYAIYNTNVSSVDFIRIPTTRWLPTPLISHGADSAVSPSDGEGHAEGATGLGGGGDGVTLTQQGATWSVAGGKLVNTPGLGAELVTDPGLEGNYTAGLNDNLTKGGAPTVAQSGDVHGGAKAQQYVSTAQYDNVRQQVTYDASSWYQMSVWGKRTVGAADDVYAQWYIPGSSTIAGYHTGAAYAQILEIERTAAGGAEWILLAKTSTAGASDTVIVDDFSVKKLTLNTLFLTASLSTANVYAQADLVVTAGTQAGLVIALDSAASPANFMIAYHDGTNCKLDKNVAGTYTNVVSAAAAYSANAPIVVTKDGTAVRLYYNNALVGSGTVSDAGIVDNTIHGLFSTYSGNTIDDVVMYARGTGGEYDSVLDIYTQVS